MQTRFFEKLQISATRLDSKCGILTFGDANYFPGIQLLYNSVGRRTRIVLMDLGLAQSQLNWCRPRMAVIRPRLFVPKNIEGWQARNKPFYLDYSPFHFTLFLDSDTMAVGDLTPIFDAIRQRPVCTQHPHKQNYCRPNNEKIYEMFPVKRRLAPQNTINTGVTGFCLSRWPDSQIVSQWKYMTRLAAQDPDIRELLTWWDEGCFHWAIQSTGDVDNVVPCERKWNTFAGAKIHSKNPADFIEALPTDQAVILHFTGQPKPWCDWPKDIF